VRDDPLAGLNARQREAAMVEGRPLLVLAGAGTGKTRTLVARITWLIARGLPTRSVLALAFTNRAAEEMRVRLAELLGPERAGEVSVSTCHSFCCRLCRAHAADAGRTPRFSIFDRDDTLAALRRLMSAAERAVLTPAEVAARIAWHENALCDAAEAAAWAQDERERLVARVWLRYERELAASDALGLDDLVAAAVRLLDERPALAQAWGRRFRHVLVDEYQDTNPAQLRLLRLLCHTHRGLTVVGDDDQAIYRFRGADASCISGLERRFSGAAVVTLEENYRSTPEILAAANALIAHNRARREKQLHTARPSGPAVAVHWFASAAQEARAVAAELAAAPELSAQGAGAAVLYRSRLVRPELEQALAAAGIPYRVLGDLGLYERRVVRDALAYLRAACNPRDREAFSRAAAAPRRGIGAAALTALIAEAERTGATLVECAHGAEALSGLAAPARAALARLGAELADLCAQAATLGPGRLLEQALLLPGGLVEHLRARTEADAGAAADLERLRELLRAARAFEERAPAARAWDFLSEVQLAAGEDAADADGATPCRVTLATIHAAKGAEWDLVWVAGVEAGTLPSHHARGVAAIEEERRLLYVALTRARRRLVVSGAARRAGRAHARSPFLSELAPPASARAA